MIEMKIQTGCWREGTLGLVGMPKDFVLSARKLVVMETSEYDLLIAAMNAVKDCFWGCGENMTPESYAIGLAETFLAAIAPSTPSREAEHENEK